MLKVYYSAYVKLQNRFRRRIRSLKKQVFGGEISQKGLHRCSMKTFTHQQEKILESVGDDGRDPRGRKMKNNAGTSVQRLEQELKLLRFELGKKSEELTQAREKLEISKANLTDRKKVQEEQVRLSTAIGQAAEAVAISNFEGSIHYVNPAFERITGYGAEEVLGRPMNLLRRDDLGSDIFREIDKSIVRGNFWQGRAPGQKKNGSLYDADMTISPVRDDLGKVSDVVFVWRDVTREMELEAQLLQSQKMEAIGTLAGGIAHDLNNLLSPIIGYADLAMRDLQPGSEIHDALEQIAKAGNRAAKLVSQIMSFSMKAEDERKPIRLQPIIRETLKLLKETLPTTIGIKTRVDTKSSSVLGSYTQIQQMLMNLCTNAYHAMRERGGTLWVRLSEMEVDPAFGVKYARLSPGRYLRLDVSDTGCGMDKDTMDRIFEPFFTTKKVGEGTGLGLATVHGIVKSHGGAIIVQSEPRGGTTFEVFLPVITLREERCDIEEVTEDESLPTGKGSILVVDDEEILLRMAQRVLTRLGYDVTAFRSSTEALEAFCLDPNRFDIVLTDQTMPDLTGVELSQKLLEIRPDIPIILSSGYNNVVDQEQAKTLGIRKYIVKPLLVQDLATSIKRYLTEKIV